jgi:hypothetical protein
MFFANVLYNTDYVYTDSFNTRCDRAGIKFALVFPLSRIRYVAHYETGRLLAV